MTLPKQKYETKTELRELLSNLLKNCLEISAWDSLSYNRRFSTSPCPDKPFADIFKKYRKNVFTNSIIHHFLELLLYAGSDTNPVIFKAINIIEMHPIFGYAYNNINQNNDLFSQCPDKEISNDQCTFSKCIECLYSKKKPLKEECKLCPIYKLYSALSRLDADYDNIMYAKKHCIHLKDFYNVGEETIVEKTYNTIQEYENEKNSYYKMLNGFQKTKELINQCEQTINIINYSDEKLAYIKWYTGHLYTWPYYKMNFWKARELESKNMLVDFDRIVSLTDEKHIWDLANEAVTTCQKLIDTKEYEWSNPELPYNAEIDKIVSCLYMYWNKDFYKLSALYCTIVEECNKLLKIPTEDKAKMGLYIEMWNFSYCIGRYENAQEYANEIENLFKTGKLLDSDTYIFKIRYLTYKYFNRELEYLDVVKAVSKYAKLLRKSGYYNDTVDMVTTALQYKASTYSQNDGITMVALAGYEQNETQNIPNMRV